MSDAPYKLTLCDSDDSGKTVYSVDTPAGERFDTVKIHRAGVPAETEWLWAAHVALGKVTVIEGAPGSGKSRVAFDLAARAASRLPWPDGTPNMLPAADVLVISRQEEAGHITAQMRRAAGANGEVRSVFRFEGFATDLPKADRYGDRPVAFPFDLEALDYHLRCPTAGDEAAAITGDAGSVADHGRFRACYRIAPGGRGVQSTQCTVLSRQPSDEPNYPQIAQIVADFQRTKSVIAICENLEYLWMFFFRIPFAVELPSNRRRRFSTTKSMVIYGKTRGIFGQLPNGPSTVPARTVQGDVWKQPQMHTDGHR